MNRNEINKTELTNKNSGRGSKSVSFAFIFGIIILLVLDVATIFLFIGTRDKVSYSNADQTTDVAEAINDDSSNLNDKDISTDNSEDISDKTAKDQNANDTDGTGDDANNVSEDGAKNPNDLNDNNVPTDDIEEQSEPTEWTITQYASIVSIQSMCYTIEDDLGRLAIVDGGYAEDAENLRTIIASHDNHVDSWIITHPHPDHATAFNVIMNDYGEIQIDEIYSVDVNVERYRETAQSYDVFEVCEEFYRILGETDPAKIHFEHKGDTFEVLGLKAEVFSAWDENVDALPDHLCNDGSMMFLLSAPEESMFFCADVQKEMEPFIELSDEACAASYIQTGHHGNWGLNIAFYDNFTNPTLAFFDSTDALLNPDSNFDALALKEYFEERGVKVVNFSDAPTSIVLH